MWKNLSEEEQLKYYKRWILDTLKDETLDSLKKHIIKHAHEISEREPVEWSASMRNLVDAFDAICGCNPSIQLRLKKLADKYKEDPERFTPPPEIKEKYGIASVDMFLESKDVKSLEK